jgi:hypothetical protein
LTLNSSSFSTWVALFNANLHSDDDNDGDDDGDNNDNDDDADDGDSDDNDDGDDDNDNDDDGDNDVYLNKFQGVSRNIFSIRFHTERHKYKKITMITRNKWPINDNKAEY